MKALVYNGPGKKAVEERPMPRVALSTDAVVKISKTTICGTDLHILKGDVPSCVPGRVLGHEGVGIITELGQGVTGFRVGDHVLISCISSWSSSSSAAATLSSRCAGVEVPGMAI